MSRSEIIKIGQVTIESIINAYNTCTIEKGKLYICNAASACEHQELHEKFDQVNTVSLYKKPAIPTDASKLMTYLWELNVFAFEFTSEFVQQVIISFKGIEHAAINYDVYNQAWRSMKCERSAFMNNQRAQGTILRETCRFQQIFNENRTIKRQLWALALATVDRDNEIIATMKSDQYFSIVLPFMHKSGLKVNEDKVEPDSPKVSILGAVQKMSNEGAKILKKRNLPLPELLATIDDLDKEEFDQVLLHMRAQISVRCDRGEYDSDSSCSGQETPSAVRAKHQKKRDAKAAEKEEKKEEKKHVHFELAPLSDSDESSVLSAPVKMLMFDEEQQLRMCMPTPGEEINQTEKNEETSSEHHMEMFQYDDDIECNIAPDAIVDWAKNYDFKLRMPTEEDPDPYYERSETSVDSFELDKTPQGFGKVGAHAHIPEKFLKGETIEQGAKFDKIMKGYRAQLQNDEQYAHLMNKTSISGEFGKSKYAFWYKARFVPKTVPLPDVPITWDYTQVKRETNLNLRNRLIELQEDKYNVSSKTMHEIVKTLNQAQQMSTVNTQKILFMDTPTQADVCYRSGQPRFNHFEAYRQIVRYNARIDTIEWVFFPFLGGPTEKQLDELNVSEDQRYVRHWYGLLYSVKKDVPEAYMYDSYNASYYKMAFIDAHKTIAMPFMDAFEYECLKAGVKFSCVRNTQQLVTCEMTKQVDDNSCGILLTTVMEQLVMGILPANKLAMVPTDSLSMKMHRRRIEDLLTYPSGWRYLAPLYHNDKSIYVPK